MIIPVLHNISSVQRLVDTARVAYQLGYKTLVVAKAYGGAAQNGIPEAYKLALRYEASLIVLPDLQDAVEVLEPDSTLLVTPEDPETLIGPGKSIKLEGKTLIVFNGGDTLFSPSELKLGKRIYIEGVSSRLGAVAEAGLLLYLLRR